MKLKFLFLSLIFLISVFTLRSQTQESDTVWVKTFEWGKYPSFGTFSPTNDSIILMSGRSIQIRATKDGELLREYPPVFPENLRIFNHAFACSPNGKYVCYGGEAKYIVLLNLETGINRIITAVDSFTNGWVQSLCFSPDSKTLALSTDNYDLGNYIGQKFEFWDVESGSLNYSHQTNEELEPLAYTHDGKYLVAGFRRKGYCKLEVFSADSCNYLYGIEDNYDENFGQFVVSNDNSFVASSSFGGYLKIWDLNQKKLTKKINTEQIGDSFIKISSENRYIVVGNFSSGQTKIYDVSNNRFIHSYSYGSGDGIDITKDNKYILSSSASLALLNFLSDTEVEEIDNDTATSILSPNPTNGMLTISLNSFSGNKINFKVSNNSGILIFTKELINNLDNYTFDTSTLSNGTYYCTVETEKEIKTYKIIINK